MKSHHYESESHMRAANYQIASLLANKAELKDGVYTATENGVRYSWNADGDARRETHPNQSDGLSPSHPTTC